MVLLHVGNINTRIEGDVDSDLRLALTRAMRYKTKEYNGFEFVELEHNLFNKSRLTFPTGLYSKAATVLKKYDIDFDFIDDRKQFDSTNKPLKLHEVTPYDYQEKIITDSINSQRFIIQVATGGGKTVIAAAILARLNVPSLFVVHTGDLFEQAHDELSRMLKIPIGKIGGGEFDIQQINVCMVQTIHSVLKSKYIPFDEVEKEQMEKDEIVKKSYDVRNEEVKKAIQNAQCVLIDECHHLRSNSYVSTMKACKNAFYRGGMSATPHAGDSRDIILQAYAGKIVGKITASFLIKNGYLVKPKIYYLLGSKSGAYKYSRQRYNSIYKKHIVENAFRNQLIVDCVERFKELEKSVLITVTTKKHGKMLLKMISELDVSVEFLYSKVNKLERKKFIQQVRDKKLDVIIGTSLADEGLNIPALDSLILAGGGKSKTRIIQRIGRTLRLSNGKDEAIVVDFKDCYRYLLGHYKERRKMCEAEPEFEIIESF